MRGPKTKCKICECSIYDIDPVVWSLAGVSPGLVHATCVEDVTKPPKETA